MPPTNADDILETFFAAIERGDLDAIAALYDEELAVWHSNDGVTQGKQENLKTLRWLTRVAAPRYEILERIAAGDTVAQRHRLHLTTLDGKHAWSGDAAIFFTLKDGRIARIDEYIDGDAVRRLTELLTRPEAGGAR